MVFIMKSLRVRTATKPIKKVKTPLLISHGSCLTNRIVLLVSTLLSLYKVMLSRCFYRLCQVYPLPLHTVHQKKIPWTAGIEPCNKILDAVGYRITPTLTRQRAALHQQDHVIKTAHKTWRYFPFIYILL